MSSNVSPVGLRRHAGRLKRIAVSAIAVTVGAIVLSGCVVIQSESAQQANVIGTSVTISTVICASQQAAAPPCNSGGNSVNFLSTAPNASATGQLLVGYRIAAGVTAPPTISTTAPTTGGDGSPITATLTLTQDAAYTAGLGAILPAPAGTQWVGYVSSQQKYLSSGQTSITIAPTFGLPAGATGSFSWRTVVGFRSALIKGDIQCPGGFPGAVASPIPGQPGSVCVDSPDIGTIQGPPSTMQLADISITPPPTPTYSAGSPVTLGFTGLFSGGNPTSAPFTVAASTTLPGVTPTAPASFVPASNSSNSIPVSLTIPASTPVGTYDVTVTATVGGISRSGTGHITVKPSAKTIAAGKAARLTAVVKTTTLKAARKNGIALTFTLSRASAVSLVALQTKPKVSVTVKKSLKAGKKTVILVKSKKLHKGKVTITFKGGGVTRVITTTLK